MDNKTTTQNGGVQSYGSVNDPVDSVEDSTGNDKTPTLDTKISINSDDLILPAEYRDPVPGSCLGRCRRKYMCEKLLYLVTCVSLLFLAGACFTLPWLILYFYSITAPPLIFYRIYSYTKLRWHLFLLDFCYFVNAFCIVVIWGIPGETAVFQVLYSLTHGPVLLAVIIFRNSLVMHDVDRITSSYIHLLPPLCTFVIRWYPEQVSAGWYTEFTYQFDEPPIPLLWIYVIPMVSYIGHLALFVLLVEVIIKPKADLWYSYSYLSGKTSTWYGKMINCCGDRHRRMMYYFLNCVLAALEISVTYLSYKFFPVNCTLHIAALSIVIWNGGTYNIDIFGKSTLEKQQAAKEAQNQAATRSTY